MNQIAPQLSAREPRCLVIACGALASDIIALRQQLGLSKEALTLQCLPAGFHNTPARIAPAVEEILQERARDFDHILVAYGECGTGGALDDVLHRYGASRMRGAHCYEFYAQSSLFSQIVEKDIGSFFLTDYLVRNFDRLVIAGLGLDRFPELRDVYFSNYTQIVFLSQSHDPDLLAKAKVAAQRLALKLRHIHVGYGELTSEITALANKLTDLPGVAGPCDTQFEEQHHVCG